MTRDELVNFYGGVRDALAANPDARRITMHPDTWKNVLDTVRANSERTPLNLPPAYVPTRAALVGIDAEAVVGMIQGLPVLLDDTAAAGEYALS